MPKKFTIAIFGHPEFLNPGYDRPRLEGVMIICQYFSDQMIHKKIFEGEAMFNGGQATTLVLYFVKLNNSQVIFQIIQDYEMLARI